MMDWFHSDDWPTPAEWQALAAVATALIALIAAVVAVRQYRISVNNQIEQARPFITVDFDFLGTIAVSVVVENTGKTAAYGVTFEWDKRPVAVDELTQGVIDRAMVHGNIPFLAPGRKIRYYLNDYDDDEQTEIPRRYEVRAEYRGPEGGTWRSVSILDIDQWAKALVDRDPYETVTRELRKLVRAAAYRRQADETLIRAADSVNVFLEASPRVSSIRADKAERIRQRKESHRRFESERLAKKNRDAIANSGDEPEDSEKEV